MPAFDTYRATLRKRMRRFAASGHCPRWNGAMRQTYRAVAERIRQELADIDEVVNRAQKIWGDMDTVTANDYRLDAVALNLQVSAISQMMPFKQSSRTRRPWRR